MARVTAEVKRRQRQEQKERARLPKQREHVLVTATIAFTHGPPAGSTIAAATLRKYAGALGEDEDACILEHGNRFLATPVDTLAQWLDCSEDIPRTTQSEAERMVGDARLLRWVEEDNGARGVASPPQLVWEKACALGVDKKCDRERCAASWRLRRSAAAKKWMQWVWQRGNLRLGRLPAKDILPMATMRAKAPAASHKKCDSGPTLGRILGAAERPPFGGRVFVFS